MKKTIIILLSILALSSCNLDYAPENTMVDEIVYKAENTAEAALMGAYESFNNFIGGQNRTVGSVVYITAYPFLYADVGTNTLTSRNYDTYISMETSEYSTDMHDGFILETYRRGYNAIDYANAVIRGVTDFGKYNEATMAQHIAEAKFIRSYCYLTLLEMYGDGALTGEENGLGLVLRTEPYSGYNPNEIQARETVGTIYDQIIKDLTEAIVDLPSSEYSAGSRIGATQGGCKALLSRVYLYRGSYTNNAEYLNLAASYALEVINGGGFVFSNSATDHRDNIFPNNMVENEVYPDPKNYSNEIIFFQPSRFSTADYACGLHFYFTKSYYFVPESFINSYLKGDYRGYVDGSSSCLIGQGSTSNYSSDFTTLKYDNSEGYSDVIYLRLSEVKLTYAEAIARATRAISSEALKQLNDIRCKPFDDEDRPAVLTAGSFSSVDSFINEVLTERSRELAYEGQSRCDLIRTGRGLKNSSIPNNRKMLPIPQYEVNISNGVIKQNTGYAQ